MLGGNLDQDLLLKLNTLAGPHPQIFDIADNSLLRGFPIFFALVALWFSDGSEKRRARMLAGLLAVCIATILSVWCQFNIAVHTRPLLDPALHLKTVDIPWFKWDRLSSFPSDTATLFFGLATVVLLENRLAGLFCFLWAAVVITIPRVAFGFHYPSDLIGSLVLASACVFLLVRFTYPRAFLERALFACRDHMYVVHALLFVFLTEVSNLFQSVQEIGKDLIRILHS